MNNQWANADLSRLYAEAERILAALPDGSAELELIRRAMDLIDDADTFVGKRKMESGIPFFCKPCGETLAETQSICPFCGQDAVEIDELA